MNLSASVLAILISSDVWAVYGIGVNMKNSCSHCSDTVFVTGRTTNDTTPATSPSAAPSSSSTVDLDTGIKLGIGIAAGVLIVALLIVAIEACYLRKKRRERGLQRAIDEVEIGVHKGSEERMVLESRVSIIVEDEGQEEQEEDEAEVERGRNGMSLPRRD